MYPGIICVLGFEDDPNHGYTSVYSGQECYFVSNPREHEKTGSRHCPWWPGRRMNKDRVSHGHPEP